MSHKITAVIVDDEAPARKILRSLLSAHPNVEVIGEAGDVLAAAELCERLKPGLVFLDIQLPRMDGFALLPLLSEVPEIIFVTAHDRHAVRAFEVNALDYLLKPIAPARLEKSLTRLSQVRHSSEERMLDTDLVALREDSQLRMMPVSSITHIEAEDNYTRVYLRDQAAAMVRRPMGDWENLLPDGSFIRVSRSLIIRLDAVQKFISESRDLTQVTLLGRTSPLVIGRKASLRLKNAMDKT